MIKFKTITNWRRVDFDKEVEQHLNEGWEITGGVSVAINSVCDEKTYAISLIKVLDTD